MENYIEIVTLYVLVIPSLVLPQSCLESLPRPKSKVYNDVTLGKAPIIVKTSLRLQNLLPNYL